MTQPPAHSMTVLVIEDDPATQANLHDILELDGYTVKSATSLKQALALNSWTEFAAILLDRQLPDGRADEILPRLKQLAPEAAVVIITGYADLDGTINALRYGAMDYLLKPVNPDLLRASLARIAQFKEAERRAKQAERLAAIGQMMTGLAHESGNALARIQACLEMLEMEVEDNPEALDLIGRIQKAQNDLQRLFEEIRNYAAPLKLHRELEDVSSIWRQAWNNLSMLHKNRQVRLHEQTTEVDLEINVDGFRLEQVFRNIFENALAACADPMEINVICRLIHYNSREMLEITVRDNGPGLTEEGRRRIFDPFYTTKTKGTGLGMAIARRIVEAHGGEINVAETETSEVSKTSEVSAGTEIRIFLPRGETS